METCGLVHVNCGACGSPIALGGTCGCPDIKHPVGVAAQDRVMSGYEVAAEWRDKFRAAEARIETLRDVIDTADCNCGLTKTHIGGRVCGRCQIANAIEADKSHA